MAPVNRYVPVGIGLMLALAREKRDEADRRQIGLVDRQQLAQEQRREPVPDAVNRPGEAHHQRRHGDRHRRPYQDLQEPRRLPARCPGVTERGASDVKDAVWRCKSCSVALHKGLPPSVRQRPRRMRR